LKLAISPEKPDYNCHTMETARLRRTFKYPEDEDMPENMDEQGWNLKVFLEIIHVAND
jgi:hypothetical protein